MKNYLQISTGNLKMVLEKVQLLLKSQHIEYDTAIAKSQDKTIKCLMISFFSEVIGRVTPFALLKILQQYDILGTKDIGFCHHSL